MEIVYYKNGYAIMDGDRIVHAGKNKESAETMLRVLEGIPEPQPEPTEQELVQAEMLLNQIEIMQRQAEQDEVLAEILLNQIGDVIYV